jgi:hypothetical protein
MVLQQLLGRGSILYFVPLTMVDDDTPRTEESDIPTEADFVKTTIIENGPDQCGTTGSPNKDIRESGPTQDFVAQPLEQNIRILCTANSLGALKTILLHGLS